MYLNKLPTHTMQPLMRVLLCGVLVITFTLDKVHCMDPPDSNDDDALGATGYTPLYGYNGAGATNQPPSYEEALSEGTSHQPPPPYTSTQYPMVASPPPPQRPSSSVATPQQGPPPPYVSSIDLVKPVWNVSHGVFKIEETKICFQGIRPQNTLGLFHFSAETTVQLPTYAGYLVGEVFTKGKCPSKPELEIKTQYRWGWETVLKNHAISTHDVSSFEKVPVYGQPLFGPNLMFAFKTPSKHCKICFGPLQVTPNTLINHLVLSKPKKAEATACTGQWQPRRDTISLGMYDWESFNESAQFVGTETQFCIVPTKKGKKRGKMEIEAQTHSAELIRFIEGTVTSRCSTDVKMKVWTNVPGTGVETYRELLHPSQPVSFKAPVYACTNETYHLLNITLRFTGTLNKDSKICFDDLRLPQPLAA